MTLLAELHDESDQHERKARAAFLAELTKRNMSNEGAFAWCVEKAKRAASTGGKNCKAVCSWDASIHETTLVADRDRCGTCGTVVPETIWRPLLQEIGSAVVKMLRQNGVSAEYSAEYHLPPTVGGCGPASAYVRLIISMSWS